MRLSVLYFIIHIERVTMKTFPILNDFLFGEETRVFLTYVGYKGIYLQSSSEENFLQMLLKKHIGLRFHVEGETLFLIIPKEGKVELYTGRTPESALNMGILLKEGFLSTTGASSKDAHNEYPFSNEVYAIVDLIAEVLAKELNR